MDKPVVGLRSQGHQCIYQQPPRRVRVQHLRDSSRQKRQLSKHKRPLTSASCPFLTNGDSAQYMAFYKINKPQDPKRKHFNFSFKMPKIVLFMMLQILVLVMWLAMYSLRVIAKWIHKTTLCICFLIRTLTGCRMQMSYLTTTKEKIVQTYIFVLSTMEFICNTLLRLASRCLRH